MSHSNDSFNGIAISGGDEGGARSENHHKSLPDTRRTNSLNLPVEEHKCSSFSKLSFKSMIINPLKFRDSMKGAGTNNSMQISRDGSISLRDEELVVSFRRMLLEDDQLPAKHNDYHTLYRFLRMRAFDLMKAKEMYLKMIKWRDDNAVDAIYKEFKFEEDTEVKRCYPHGFHGVDTYGRPLYIERIGMIDLNRLLQVTTTERFLKHHIAEQEKTLNLRYPACSIAAKKPITSITSILDVKGVGMNNFSKPARELFMEIQKIDSNNYPETLHRLFIVNAGSGFRVLWRALKAFLDPRTLAKIQVLGSNFQNSLAEVIDPSTLPSFLGGYCTCSEFGGCLLNDKGPWNDPEIMERLPMGPKFSNEVNSSMTVVDAIVPSMNSVNNPNGVNTLQDTIQTSHSVESEVLEQHRQTMSSNEHVNQKFQALEAGLEEMKKILAGLLIKQEDFTRQVKELKKVTLPRNYSDMNGNN